MRKNLYILLLLLFLIFTLTSCLSSADTNTSSSASNTDVSGSTSEVNIEEDTITSDFSLLDENNNEISQTNGIYTISEAGTYVATGSLEGQIYVDASDQDVELVLENVSITNSNLAPIYVSDCTTFELKIKNNTTNYIYDYRTTDYSDDSSKAQAAVFVANGNLKVTGKGTLSIISKTNSGLQSKDNVTVKNVTLLIKAQNNGIKGNDKVTIEENPTIGIVAGNNGITTSNSDKGSNAQHGYIYITGGTITINSYGDGIDAAYAVLIESGTDSEGISYTPIIDIYTNIYSSYSLTETKTSNKSQSSAAETLGGRPGGGFGGGGFGGGTSAEKADDSAKGIKACESITISDGVIFIYAYDDGIHTNNDKLENGSTANANIIINGGTLKIKVSDDGIHADGKLNISGGEVIVSESHEGIEANIINISGGSTTVLGDDDGVNASSQINISGGRLDVTVSPNGDTDGIDSNGSITISGGTIITRGPNSDMAAPIDADGQMKMTGGILIVIGYAPRSLSTSLTKTSSSSGLTSGSHTVTIDSVTISYNNSYSYSGQTTVYASKTATIK